MAQFVKARFVKAQGVNQIKRSKLNVEQEDRVMSKVV
jgi:hypothetical protein